MQLLRTDESIGPVQATYKPSSGLHCLSSVCDRRSEVYCKEAQL